jgi:pilus assembly protein TadC
LSDIELAIANLAKREKDGSLKRSESLSQQAIELQKKVAEYQKKSVSVKKLESLSK